MKKLSGKIWKFGDNIDTDIIIAARYLNTSDPKELAKHIMEDKDPDFINKIQKGDIIVAGENFGSGSSREHAPIALKAAGISAVVAKSFARIFYRNSFNMGLPIFELADVDELKEGKILNIDMDNGEIIQEDRKYKFIPIPEFMQKLIQEGGLMSFAKTKIAQERNS